MGTLNLTPSGPSTFILNGMSGLEAAHIWIAIPFLVFYIISLLGNFIVLLVVSKEQTLHKPMYLLFCMLALTDIAVTTCIVPKALCIFWFGVKDITVDGCLTQMFFLLMIPAIHSFVLVTMAYDRYIAICDPLRYTTILTNARIAQLGLVGLIRGIMLTLPLPLLLHRLPFCTNPIIHNTYCSHNVVVNMVRADTSVSKTYSLVVNSVVTQIDLTLICLSYGLIIKAVLGISSRKAHQKALNTCTAHICVMLISYMPSLFSALTQKIGQDIAAHFHILLANFYILLPPTLNPIIYGLKTKEFREKVVKNLLRM